MSKPRKKKIWFDEDQAKWLDHYLSRKKQQLESMAQNKPEIKEMHDYIKVMEMSPKVAKWQKLLDDRGQIVVSLNKREIRFLQKLIQLQLEFVDKGLQGYEERSMKLNKDYSEYTNRLQTMKAMFKVLQKKLGGRL